MELSTKIKPKGISKDDIVVNNSDSTIVSVTDITLTDTGIYTEIRFKCNAVAAGTSIIKITSADGKITSNDVTFTIEQAPKIKTISKFSTSYASDEVGDTRNVTVYIRRFFICFAGLVKSVVVCICVAKRRCNARDNT